MVHPGSGTRRSFIGSFIGTPRQEARMIPPRGFRAELFPLRHKFDYSVGLNLLNDAQNTTMCTIVRGSADSAMIDPNAIEVNPHNPTFAQETGVICHQMSILEKIKINMKFTLTEDALADGVKSLTVKYMPIFCSFPEKLASTDDRTGVTAASILELVGDATNQDVTPLYTTTNLPESAGLSSVPHPVSTVNDTEVFGDLNLSVDLKMESVAWDNDTFFNSVKFFTNKGAIRSMVGQQRSVYLTDNRPTKRIFINKFVPGAVRRIVNHSFFGMLFHCPVDTEVDQDFFSGAITTGKCHVGIKMGISYHEWNADHRQEVHN